MTLVESIATVLIVALSAAIVGVTITLLTERKR